MKEMLLREFKQVLSLAIQAFKDSKQFMIPRLKLALAYMLSSEEDKRKYSKEDRESVIVVGYLLLTPFIFIVAPIVIIKILSFILW